MQHEDLARESTLATSATVAAGYVTITLTPTATRRVIVLSADWTSDLAPVAESPVELQVAGSPVYFLSGGQSDSREIAGGICPGTVGQTVTIRLKVTTSGRLSCRWYSGS